MTGIAQPNVDQVDIRPGVGVLSLMSYVNYKPWFALAEFVDNALQSFLTHRAELQGLHGDGVKLKVHIEASAADGGRIVIRDTAAGISGADFQRAFRPAEVPPDRQGLSEFGIGMKSAASWFANCWTVRTSALGENVERSIRFDIDTIVRNNIEKLAVQTISRYKEDHFTEIILESLNHGLQTKTLGKVRDHLGSIYRVFIRDGVLELFINNELLEFKDFNVLHAPYYRTPDGESLEWRKDIDFDLGDGQRVHGFAALREVGDTKRAGFALFRRGRLIEGSGEDTYRPDSIFRAPNSYTYQRLSGELHLEGFEVSHTKDGFRWGEDEEPFLDLLKKHLDDPPLRLLDQAEGHRSRPRAAEVKKAAEASTANVAAAVTTAAPIMTRQIERQEEGRAEEPTPPKAAPPAATVPEAPLVVRDIDLDLRGEPWRVRLEQTLDPAVGDWLTIYYPPNEIVENLFERRRLVTVRLSLAHPFMQAFGGPKGAHLEPLVRVAVALALGEVAAREGGAKMPGLVRQNMNELLRDALSKLPPEGN